MSSLVKPIEYAKSQGLSRQAVYAKIKKGLLSSKMVDGKIYIVVDEESRNDTDFQDKRIDEKNIETLTHVIEVQELLNSKEETISVLKESISDLKQTNTEINTTLRGEIELLKQVFMEMRNLYVKQIDYMSTEKKLELENRFSSQRVEDSLFAIEKISNDEEECWITLDDFFRRSHIFKEKHKSKIIKHFKKAHKKEDARIKIEDDMIYLSCYHYYDDILDRVS